MHQTDEANRLTSDDSYTYVYDLNGNLTGKLAKAGTGLSNWDYSYDALDQLIEVRQDSLTVESYRYDAFGRRSLIRTVEGAGPTADTAILNDGSDRAIDITQGAVGQAVPVRRYTHSANVDEPLQVETFDAAGSFDARYTYHADHLGSIRYLTDASGTIVNAYDYDSYGRPMFGVTAFDQPFAYTGREWDTATGLYHYRARAYDAEMGRFLQEDPIALLEFDSNPYRYANVNSVSFTDPTGYVAALETGGTKQFLGTAPTIHSIGKGLECLFNTIAASVELEHNFFDDEHQGLQVCGGKVVDGAIGAAATVGVSLAAQKASKAGTGLLKKISKKLKARRELGLLPTAGEKFLKNIDNLLLSDKNIQVLFDIRTGLKKPFISLTFCAASPNSCTRTPLILNL